MALDDLSWSTVYYDIEKVGVTRPSTKFFIRLLERDPAMEGAVLEMLSFSAQAWARSQSDLTVVGKVTSYRAVASLRGRDPRPKWFRGLLSSTDLGYAEDGEPEAVLVGYARGIRNVDPRDYETLQAWIDKPSGNLVCVPRLQEIPVDVVDGSS